MAIDVPPTFSRSAERNTTLLNLVTNNPVPCGTDGIMGITQDMAHGLIVHTHIAEEMEENLSLAVISPKDFLPMHPHIYRTLEQKFSNNCLDIEALREGKEVIYLKGEQQERLKKEFTTQGGFSEKMNRIRRVQLGY